jgi:energy-coupling factor transporter ATP-binding protein EcfA2
MSEDTTLVNQPYFLKHYKYLIDNPESFSIFFPAKATSTIENKQNDFIVITGKKGSGKSELSKTLAYIFKQNVPDAKFVVFTGVPTLYDDLAEVIGDKDIVEMDLDEVAEEEQELPKNDFSNLPHVEDFAECYVIFDDTEEHEDPKIEKMLWKLLKSIARKGRNYRITLVAILQTLNRGLTSMPILKQMDALVIFPSSYDVNTHNTIRRYIGIPDDVIRALFELRNEKFVLIRQSYPHYFFLGTSMIKTNNFNTILKKAYGSSIQPPLSTIQEDTTEEVEDSDVDIDGCTNEEVQNVLSLLI